MPRVRLIHFSPGQVEERAGALRAAGYEVNMRPPQRPGFFRDMREHPPAAIIIDLSKLPSHGREVGIALRQSAGTRHIPLVFAEGDPEKVERVREALPDAVYTTWSRIRSALKQAIAHPRLNPVVPKAMMERYAATPLAKKLGIKANAVVALISAPEDFEATLGDLPDGVQLRERLGGRTNVVVWFARSRDELERGVDMMAARLYGGCLWIAWPKKSSGMAKDLTQNDVRALGLAAGLVDYKICAIDATWSGLAFVRRKK